MLNQVYRLVSERKFDTFIVSQKINEDTIVVKPTYLSLCHADQRYYAFKRKSEIINKKLPMALVHEGIGQVVYSNNSNFSIGERVVMIPNIPIEQDDVVGENYIETSKFRSSNCDGLTQEFLFTNADQLVKLDDKIPNTVGSYIEMLSVSNQAVNRLDHIANKKRDVIGVLGDGNLAYMVSTLLKLKFPNSKLYIFGRHRTKLNYFSFADRTFLANEIPDSIRLDHCIEATGGLGSQIAIDQIIDFLNPEGSCVLMGVSENKIAVNTRMILQKGLTFIGSSRSVKKDFVEVIGLLKDSPVLIDELRILVDKIFQVTSLTDMITAFEYNENHSFGKTILEWNM